MQMLVFSTHRLIREYLGKESDTILPKLYTIDEFLRHIIVIEGRSYIDETTRLIYLYEAMSSIDTKALGISRGFLEFINDSRFIFRFFEELFAEQVDIDSLYIADTYASYDEHLKILQKLYNNYYNILIKNHAVDKITIDRYSINSGLLENISSIELYIDGYLSKFELEILSKIEIPVNIHFCSTPFNRKLIDRLIPKDTQIETNRYYTIDYKNQNITPKSLLKSPANQSIELLSFATRVEQSAFVLSKIEEFRQKGVALENIAVILPDESFASYLRLFDEYRNLNYAMGLPFKETQYYITLNNIYEYYTNNSEYLQNKKEFAEIIKNFEKIENFDEFIAFISNLSRHLPHIQREQIDKELYLFGRLKELLHNQKPLHLLKHWLNRLDNLQVDDTKGGKVTVMGVLESRGLGFEGLIVVDFNEEYVPSVEEKDMFLNSSIRKHSGMPTKSDKENLQKNYYYMLIKRSKYVAISYIESEDEQCSRFATQLNLPLPSTQSTMYKELIISPTPVVYKGVSNIGASSIFADTKITPTKIKDFLQCKRRSWYRYGLDIRSPNDKNEENFGTILHKSLEDTVKQKYKLVDSNSYYKAVMNNIYTQLYSRVSKFKVAVEWEQKIKKFCEKDFERIMTTETLVEEWLSATYNSFILTAKIDRIDIDNINKTVTIIDYKTSSNLNNTIKDENDFQMAIYHIIAKKIYPQYKIDLIYCDIYNGGKNIPVDIQEKLQKFDEVLEEIKTLSEIEYEMTKDIKHCKYCNFALSCNR